MRYCPCSINTAKCNLVKWGRRYAEDGQFAELSALEDRRIELGEYDFYFFKRVRIPLTGLQVKNIHNRRVWRSADPTYPYQGLLAPDGHELRVYLVSVSGNNEFKLLPKALKAVKKTTYL